MRVALPEFDRIAPSDELSPQVDVRSSFGEVPERIVIHDPAVVGHDVGSIARVHGRLFLGKSIVSSSRSVEIAANQKIVIIFNIFLKIHLSS